MAEGVWRTIKGRRVFIAEGEDLYTAMKKSGKFKNLKKNDEKQELSWRDKIKDPTQRNEIINKLGDKSSKEHVSKFWKNEDRKTKLSDKDIKSVKSQKALKQLIEEGKVTDITRYSDEENRKLTKKHGRLEAVKVVHGVYGMNAALLRSRTTGEYYGITSRNSNLFYHV